MTTFRRSAIVTLATALLGASLFGGCRRDPVATVELVADDLIFRGDNPTLCVPPGARVKLIVRNEANGVIHDVMIPELKLETAVLQPGETAKLSFKAPEQGTKLTYVCKLHTLMTGEIVVQENPPPDAVASRTP